ncbi:hypothetical protein LCGC14_2595380, partial [marine sediment metagenome]
MDHDLRRYDLASDIVRQHYQQMRKEQTFEYVTRQRLENIRRLATKPHSAPIKTMLQQL